jgi:CBS domain containing-hemolysin-like protein
MIWIVLAISLPAAVLLSGMGSALLNVSRVRARHAAEEGDRAAARLVRLLEHRNELHHAVTVLHHLCALAAFACCVMILVSWCGNWGWLVAIVLVLPLFLVGLEYVPKLLFRRYPFRLLRRLANPLSLLRLLAAPWIWLARLLKRKENDGAKRDDSVGMQTLAETVSSLNVLPPQLCALVEHAAGFQKLRAANLLVPLAELTALPPDMPLASAVALNAQPNHPWRAVLGADGRLLGWLDMIALPAKPASDKLVRQFMRPLLQLRATERALRCLQSLRRRAEPVAAVIDANGEAVGVLTQQDLMAAIFDVKR